MYGAISGYDSYNAKESLSRLANMIPLKHGFVSLSLTSKRPHTPWAEDNLICWGMPR